MKAIAAFALVASLAVATPSIAMDRMGYQAIAAGDLTSAERTLVAERRIFPARPELMLNLAIVYQRTGRTTEARALYRSVLSEAPVLLDMADGEALSSHVIATAALTRLTGNQMVAR